MLSITQTAASKRDDWWSTYPMYKGYFWCLCARAAIVAVVVVTGIRERLSRDIYSIGVAQAFKCRSDYSSSLRARSCVYGNASHPIIRTS